MNIKLQYFLNFLFKKFHYYTFFLLFGGITNLMANQPVLTGLPPENIQQEVSKKAYDEQALPLPVISLIEIGYLPE